ncbi:carbonic anhydrase family protein [Enterobacter kobei]|uniref:carbonic anhydrase family protein n=1 Tax=Enterobacter kobei TaxID=208224 RepID=UPI0028D2CCF5|nr:carbonic anhydrase family protein [Enterobacter kobei]WNP35112.1 carbonic anhydrase family protein [Enterobacter kobei]
MKGAFDTGKLNSELQKLWHEMPLEADETVALTQDVDISKLLPARASYYRFSGSLTTPQPRHGRIIVE